MMPTITVDDEVYAYLQSKATAFVDNPNTVIRRELRLDEQKPAARPTLPPSPPPDFYGRLRLRADATGLGDEDRYLRGRMATIYADDQAYKRSGVRSPRGADLNQLQTWIAELVGLNNPQNARLIHNLRNGSERESIDDRVTVVVEDQPK